MNFYWLAKRAVGEGRGGGEEGERAVGEGRGGGGVVDF